MKAYLIDPFQKSISEVNYSGDWQNINRMIGCDYFTTVMLNDDGDTAFVDDEGLLKDQAEMQYFRIRMAPDFHQTIAGKGLVLGTDSQGESVAPTCNIEWLEGVISFPDAHAIQIPTPEFSVYSF